MEKVCIVFLWLQCHLRLFNVWHKIPLKFFVFFVFFFILFLIKSNWYAQMGLKLSRDDYIWPYVHQNASSQLLWMESAGCNSMKMSQSSLIKPLVLSLFFTVPWPSLWNRGNIFQLGRTCIWFLFFTTLWSIPFCQYFYSFLQHFQYLISWKCVRGQRTYERFVLWYFSPPPKYDLAIAATTPSCCPRYFWEISLHPLS